MGFLEFDFQKANAQIEELEQIAADLEKLVSSRYEESMQQLGGAWKGAGAEAYMRKASQASGEDGALGRGMCAARRRSSGM